MTSNGYFVYYLPEEHYIGMTNYLKRRMYQHRKKGKCTEGMEIVACFERSVDAHWSFETGYYLHTLCAFTFLTMLVHSSLKVVGHTNIMLFW